MLYTLKCIQHVHYLCDARVMEMLDNRRICIRQKEKLGLA